MGSAHPTLLEAVPSFKTPAPFRMAQGSSRFARNEGIIIILWNIRPMIIIIIIIWNIRSMIIIIIIIWNIKPMILSPYNITIFCKYGEHLDLWSPNENWFLGDAPGSWSHWMDSWSLSRQTDQLAACRSKVRLAPGKSPGPGHPHVQGILRGAVRLMKVMNRYNMV